MNSPLSPRLQLLFDLAEGQELWDIGCDHGLLAQHNLATNKFRRVICVDRSPEVIRRFVATIKGVSPEALTDGRISAVCNDGSKLEWHHVSGAVVIAGMGAWAIEKIVRSVPPAVHPQICWVLAPQRDAGRLHSALSEMWQESSTNIETKTIIERNRQRCIFRIKSGD